MLPKIKHFLVKWMDGMKILPKHFLQLENAFIDQIRDSNCYPQGEFDYGLLPNIGTHASLELKISKQNLYLMHCRAITKGGIRIEVTKGMNIKLPLEKIVKKIKTIDSLFIILVANPFVRIPYGYPDPEESPIRVPFTRFDYHLEICGQEELERILLSPHCLVIGKLVIKNRALQIDNSYIPPSYKIASNLYLVQEFDILQEAIKKLESHLSKSIKRMINIRNPKKINPILENTYALVQKTINYLNLNIDNLLFHSLNNKPYTLVLFFKPLARIIKTLLYNIDTEEKEQLLNYYSKWTGISQLNFEKVVENLVQLNYNHLDINKAINTIKPFLNVYYKLFSKLPELEFTPMQSGILLPENTYEKYKNRNRISLFKN